jgi:hypothetical protein
LILSSPASAQASSKITAWCARRADRADDLVADFDHDASAQQDQVRQFEQDGQDRC